MTTIYVPPADSQGNSRALEIESKSIVLKKRFVEVRVVPDSGDGGGLFVAYVPSLPGVNTQASSRIEAFSRIEEALRTALDSYREFGAPPPWLTEIPEEPDTAHRSKWIEITDD